MTKFGNLAAASSLLFISGVALPLLAGPAFAADTNPGPLLGCQFHIVCIVNGKIMTGDAQKACNGGRVETIKQCPRKKH